MQDTRQYLALDNDEKDSTFRIWERFEKVKDSDKYWSQRMFVYPQCEIEYESLASLEDLASGEEEIKVYINKEERLIPGIGVPKYPIFAFRQCPQDPSYLKCVYLEKKRLKNLNSSNHDSWFSHVDNKNTVYVKVGTRLEVVAKLFSLKHARDEGVAASLFTRVKIDYGDVNLLKSWNETHDVEGYVGKTGGTRPEFILIHNSRSMGGIPIMTQHILSIRSASSQQRTGEYIHHYDAPREMFTIPALYKPLTEGDSYGSQLEALH
jgi:hypothetical protein